MALIRTVEPSIEPITVAEAKAQIRSSSAAEDALLGTYITAARQVAENELGRSLITQTWEKTIDEFPDAIELPYPRIQSVTSLKYVDTAGAQQTLAPSSYYLDVKNEPGWLIPAYGYSWPDILDRINAVEVTYIAGYGSNPSDVPQAIRSWIALVVGFYNENREAAAVDPRLVLVEMPFIGGLLDPYRVIKVA